MKSIRLVLVLSALIALNSVAIAQNVTELITIPNRHLDIYPDTFTGNYYLHGYYSINYVASLQKRNANLDLDWERSSGMRIIPEMQGDDEKHRLFFQDIHVDSNGLIIANRGSQFFYRDINTCKTFFLDTNNTLFDSIDQRGFNGYFHNNKAVLYRCNFSWKFNRDDYILYTAETTPPFAHRFLFVQVVGNDLHHITPIQDLYEKRIRPDRNNPNKFLGFADKNLNEFPITTLDGENNQRIYETILYTSDSTFIYFAQASEKSSSSSSTWYTRYIQADFYDFNFTKLHSVAREFDENEFEMLHDIVFMPDSGFIAKSYSPTQHIVRLDGWFTPRWKYYSSIVEKIHKFEFKKNQIFASIWNHRDTRIISIERDDYPFHLLKEIPPKTPKPGQDTETPTSISKKDLADNKISIYPNPSTGRFSLVHLENKSMNYQVINLQGQIVLSGRTQSEINLENYPKGMYFLKLEGENSVLKLVKE